MAVEMTMLVWSVILGLVQLVLPLLAAISDRGLLWATGPRDQPAPLRGKIGPRLDRAFRNFLETFPMFAALVLAVVVTAHTSAMTALGAQLYFWARVVYVPLYAGGVPWLRTLCWTVSMIGVVLLLVALL